MNKEQPEEVFMTLLHQREAYEESADMLAEMLKCLLKDKEVDLSGWEGEVKELLESYKEQKKTLKIPI